VLAHFPRFKPYFIDPTQYDVKSTIDFARAHHAQLQAFAAIIDPFQTVHGFSGFLPVTTLQVPPWALQNALKNMGTFFRAGPLLIPRDVPSTTVASAPTAPATAPATAAVATTPSTTEPPAPAPRPPTLPIDAPPQGKWIWMQTMTQNSSGDTAAAKVDNQEFELAPTTQEFAVPDGPQTAVEGFLRLRQTLAAEAQASG
jgi:hypothetical protein